MFDGQGCFKKDNDCMVCDYLRDTMRRMGFGIKWMDWMNTLIFNSSISTLANGSLTGGFQVTRSFGWSVITFFFLMVAEGLLGLMHNVVSLIEFQGFKLSETNSYELL